MMVLGQLGQTLDGRIATVTGQSKYINGPAGLTHLHRLRAVVDAVVVGGGDGSVRTVAGVLADTGVPLGILPLGTLNHFAKDVGIAVDLKTAAETIAKGAVYSRRTCRSPASSD